jgi:sugar-specific transcriptional regulator TrmB
MTASHGGGAKARRGLDVLGIGESEELAYRWLLSHPGATMTEISRGLSSSSARAQRLLDAIETKGLVTHSPERPRRYLPVSPDIAIEALIRRRREELDEAHSMVAELRRQTPRKWDGDKQSVELINNREAERQVFEQMHLTAEREVIVLIRPPMRISRLTAPEDYATQRKAQARGVRYRSIIDESGLAREGVTHRILEDVKAGEEIRSFPNLPFKMALVDRRIGVVPLDLQDTDSPVLLVRSSALLDAFYALFEMLWERSVPIAYSSAGVGRGERESAGLSSQLEDLVPLLAAGLNDKKIAGELSISSSTFSRRLLELMQALNARTRFQLGWLAATQSSSGRRNGNRKKSR